MLNIPVFLVRSSVVQEDVLCLPVQIYRSLSHYTYVSQTSEMVHCTKYKQSIASFAYVIKFTPDL